MTVTIADLDLDTAGQQSFDPWKSYDVRASTLNPSGRSLADYPPLSITEPYYNLAASNVTSSGATLSVTNYAQGWWYERTSPSGGSTCHSVSASPYTASLSSLTPGTTYTYKVYDQSGCNAANEKDSVSFTTPKPAASEVTATTAALSLSNWSAAWWYKGNQSGATCTSVALGSLTAGTPYTYTTYSKDGCGSADAIGTATFTTSPLAKGRHAGKDFDTLNAAGNNNPHGLWSDGAAMWVADPDDDKLYAYQMMPRLTASAVTDTAATLTLANRAGDWHYQADSGPDSTCQGPVSGASEALSGLTGGTPYVYTAYSASGCNNADKVDAVTVTAARLTAGSLATTTATLTLTGHTGNWWLKQTLPAGGTCTAGEADFSHALSNLTGGTKYTYAAYSTSSCTTPIDTVTFATHGLRAVSVTPTGATLTLTGHTGNWWLKRTAPTLGTCTAGEADFSHALSNLTGGTKYTYAAYSTSSCATPIDTVTFATHGLRAVSVTPTGAMLWLTGHTGDWWLKQTSPSTGTCTAGEADLSHALSGLTTGTSYTYTAYSNSTCATVIDTATFTPAYVAGQRYAGKDFDTLYAAGNNGPRGLWSDGTTMWVGDWDDDKIYAYRMSDRSRDAGKDFDTLHAAGNHYGSGMWSDGATMWVGDLGSDKLWAYQMPARLTASGVAASTATLTLAGYTGNWWLKQTAPTEGTCTAGEADFSHALSTLTAGVTYTWTAYSASGCASADALAAASFTTTVSVSSLANARNGSALVGRSAGVLWKAAAQFTTGGSAGGYVLSAVTIDFSTVHGSPGDLTVAIYPDSSNRPNASLVTLSGSNPSGEGQATFTCAGSCALAAGTKYHVLLEAPHATGNYNLYHWESSDSANEVTQPSNNGWSIGKSYNHANGTWSESATQYVKFRVRAVPNPALGPTSLTKTTATLALAHYVGAWWYKRTAPSGDDTCHRVANGAAASLATLTESTSYTYKAYSASGCNNADEITTATFTTPGPGDRRASLDFDTLSAAGNTIPGGVWSNGTTMWVTDWNDDKLYAYKMSDKSRDVAKDFNTLQAAGNTDPIGIWSDGTTMWVANLGDDKLYAYKMSDKSRDAAKDFNTLQAAGNENVRDVWSDGTTTWAADYSDDKLYAYKLSDKARDAGKDFNTLIAADNREPYGLWSDGTTMWVVDDDNDKIYAYKMSDKARDATRDYSTLSAAGNTQPAGIWSDGTTTWVADQIDGKLYAYWASPPTKRLLASNLTDGGARLDVTWHTAAWWYARTSPSGDTTCHSVVAGATHATLSGLDDGTAYTYTAYSASGCNSADALDTVSFTAGVSVSNLGQSRSGLFSAGYQGYKAANQFRTGSNAAGYTLSAVTIEIDRVVGSPPNLVVAIYPDSGGKPGSSARTTLSGSNPTGAGQYTFTCSTNCGLAASTSYHVVLTAPNAGDNDYRWETTSSASETRQPSDNGWTIDGADRDTGLGWQAETTDYSKFRVTALPNPSLTAPSLTLTTATLSLANYGDAWWYKRTVPAGYDTCHRVAAGTTSVTLDNLTAKTSYTYKAYSKTGCNNADEIMTTTFTTPGSGDRQTGPDFDTLTAAGNTAPVALWSNGTTVWVTDWDDDKLYAYKTSDKSRDSAKDFDTLSAAGNTEPIGIWSDGTTMWVADLADDKLYAYKMSDTSRDSARDFNTLRAAGNKEPYGLWSDGTTMWWWTSTTTKSTPTGRPTSPGTPARTTTP